MRSPAGRAPFLAIVLLLSASWAFAQSKADALRACVDQRNRDTREASAEKQKRTTDASTRENIGIRNCAGDRGCRDGVVQRWREEIRQIENDYTERLADIKKQEIDCVTAAENGATVSPPSAPDPNNEMYKLAAELDNVRSNVAGNVLAAADNFFKGLLDWGSGLLKFLAQPRGGVSEFGTPLKQIVDYLVNHEPTSFSQQYQNAQRAVQSFQENPARFLGQQVPNYLPLPAARAAEEAAGAANAGRRLLQLNAEAKQFTPLANQLTRPARNLPKLTVEPPPLSRTDRGPVIPPAGSADRGPPPGYGNNPMRPRSGIPPTCFENQCWLNAREVDNYWRTGTWREPRTRGYPGVEELADLPSPGAIIIRDLRRDHGGARALDPLHGPLGQQAQAHGIPVSSSRSTIEDVMRQRGPGAQGFTFVRWEETVGTELIGGSHVVNVRTLADGTVEFFDRATQQIAGLRGAIEPALWQNAKEVFFFLTR